jgi:signal transduction histidine kinase
VQTNKELHSLSAHLQNIREEVRTHIAREIHDELGQQLSALKMDIEWLTSKMPHQNWADGRKNSRPPYINKSNR